MDSTQIFSLQGERHVDHGLYTSLEKPPVFPQYPAHLRSESSADRPDLSDTAETKRSDNGAVEMTEKRESEPNGAHPQTTPSFDFGNPRDANGIVDNNGNRIFVFTGLPVDEDRENGAGRELASVAETRTHGEVAAAVSGIMQEAEAVEEKSRNSNMADHMQRAEAQTLPDETLAFPGPSMTGGIRAYCPTAKTVINPRGRRRGPASIPPGSTSKARSTSLGAASYASSWHTIESHISISNERVKQREKILKLLDEDSGTETKKYLHSSYEHRLSLLAQEMQNERHFEFHRFERLCLINLLNAQHELIELDEKIAYAAPNDKGSRHVKDNLCMALLRYHWAIDIFERFSKFKQPGLKASKLSGRNFAVKLREPRYYDSPDSLNLIDLTPPKPKEAIDPLRRFLQNALPARLLDAAGREQREVDVIGLKNSRTKGTEAIINYYRMHGRHVSPIVDSVARLLVAIFGGVLLLVPMTVLLLVESSPGLTLGIAFISVFIFSVVLSLVTKASNDQILAVTAAYGAVLVVFVANILPVTVKT